MIETTNETSRGGRARSNTWAFTHFFLQCSLFSPTHPLILSQPNAYLGILHSSCIRVDLVSSNTKRRGTQRDQRKSARWVICAFFEVAFKRNFRTTRKQNPPLPSCAGSIFPSRVAVVLFPPNGPWRSFNGIKGEGGKNEGKKSVTTLPSALLGGNGRGPRNYGNRQSPCLFLFYSSFFCCPGRQHIL